MYYYVVTVAYLGTTHTDSFKIDEQDLYTFIKVIIERINGIDTFSVTRVPCS